MSDNNGWIQSVDPTTGRVFYANKFTRTTQWEAPPGWHDNNNSSRRDNTNSAASLEPLPDGWEEMHDAKTNRKFYIDHVRKVTTWERPTSTVASSSRNATNHNYSSSSTLTTSILTLNQHGSHSKWADDPRHGSRHTKSSTSSSNNEPPLLSFTSTSIPDAMRPSCPSCNVAFSYTKRRHHCRLCGDVFCDACSSGRAVLPLEGEEFSVAVRVCDGCLVDVKRLVLLINLLCLIEVP
jgi:hypothetical protein